MLHSVKAAASEWRTQRANRRAAVAEGKGKGEGGKGKGKGKREKGGRGDNALADYLRYHRVGFELEEMVNEIMYEKPANPYEMLVRALAPAPRATQRPPSNV